MAVSPRLPFGIKSPTAPTGIRPVKVKDPRLILYNLVSTGAVEAIAKLPAGGRTIVEIFGTRTCPVVLILPAGIA